VIGESVDKADESVRFGVIGLNHFHIYMQVDALIDAGGHLVSFYAAEQHLMEEFAKRYPDASAAADERVILEDPSILLVASAAIPNERAPLGVQVMNHGKDFMVDKAGVTDLEQLAEVRRVQAQTGRIYSIYYAERFDSRATVRAGELVQAGAIGRVLQTVGLGPHQLNEPSRPAWFFERDKYAGILADIASHQADQFLYFTGSREAEVVASHVANYSHPNHPEFEDFGEAMFAGDGGTGFVRLDWYTPDGLSTWGDGRLFVLGTDGYIEIRKYCDIAGRPGGEHLFLVDNSETRYIDCQEAPLPYASQLMYDVLNRTGTAMGQEHCFLASELALKAQAQAKRTNLPVP